MARAGGSHSGGARVGGGHSSGPRGGGSSGGFRPSGGSRPGGGFGGPRPGGGFGGPHPGGFGGPGGPGGFMPPPPPPRRPYRGFGFGGPRPPRRRGSCLGSVLAFILMLVIIACAFSAMRADTPGPARPVQSTSAATKQRTPLAADKCQETDYYTDEQSLIESRTKLLGGLKSFYATTGVQPFIYITEEATLNDSYAQKVYEDTFTDEGHFLLLIHNSYDANGDENWDAYYLLGSDAAAVIDDDLMKQFWDYYDAAYADSSLSAEEVLSQSFARTAAVFTTAKTGTPTTAPSASVQSNVRLPLVIAGIVLLLIILLIVFTVVRNRKSQQ